PPTASGSVSVIAPTAKVPPLKGTAAGARPMKSVPPAPPTTSLTSSVKAEPGFGQPWPISAGTKPPLPARPVEDATHAPVQVVGEISAIASASPDGIATGADGVMTEPSPTSPCDQVRRLAWKVSSTKALFSTLDHTPSSMR